MKIKILSDEQTCNTTPNSFSASVVRVLSIDDTAAYTLMVKENPQEMALTINASANDTTLLTLSSGDTSRLSVGDRLVNSTNAAVVNTDVDSVIAAIINTTAVASNVDIIIANGDVTIYAVKSIRAMTVQPGAEIFIEKGPRDWLETDATANVLATGVAYSS